MCTPIIYSDTPLIEAQVPVRTEFIQNKSWHFWKSVSKCGKNTPII